MSEDHSLRRSSTDTKPLPLEWKQSVSDIISESPEKPYIDRFVTESNDYADAQRYREIRQFLDKETKVPTFPKLPDIKKFLKKKRKLSKKCKTTINSNDIVDNLM